MDNFVVSARKYRPSTFDTVVGQSSLVTTLKNAIKSSHLAHAYLFCGPRGVGKTTCARIFAKTINCQNLTTNYEACNECESCKSFNEQRSFNIHELDAASNNGVEGIRTLIDQVRIPPQIGKYSVYIIDEVHMLSQGAFNAFLKTLEEPPSYAIFILATTEKHKILPTILSRCQIYDFNRISVTDTVSYLKKVAENEGITVDDNALSIVAHKSEGGMRDALSIFDQLVSFCGKEITYQGVIDNLNVLDYDYYFRLIDCFLSGDVSQSLLIFNDILNKGFDAHQFIVGLSAHFRDVLVSKDPQTIVLLDIGKDIGEKYITQAQNCSADFLFRALKIMNDCDVDYRLSKNKRLLVELALIRICQLMNDEKKKIILSDDDVFPLKKIAQDTENKNIRESETSPSTTNQPSAVHLPTTPTVTRTQNIKVDTENHSTRKNEPFKPESISILLQKDAPTNDINIAVEPVEYQEKIQEDEPFTDNQLSETWEKFGQTITENIRLVTFFRNNFPIRASETEFTIEVDNSLQEKELRGILPSLTSYFHQELQNSTIQFVIRMAEKNDSSVVYNQLDQFKMMVSKSAGLALIIEELQLEID